jgi:hypothetical protein
MATLNPTAVEKTMDDLTNQETITSIMNTLAEVTGVSCSECMVDLPVAILKNPAAMEIVEWFMPNAEGRSPDEQDLATFLADFISAVRMLPTTEGKPTAATHKEKPKEAAKKFVPPLAKVLRFNLEGKAVEDVMSADRVYMAQYFKASIWRWSEEEISNLAAVYRMDEAERSSPTKEDPASPTPPAA